MLASKNKPKLIALPLILLFIIFSSLFALEKISVLAFSPEGETTNDSEIVAIFGDTVCSEWGIETENNIFEFTPPLEGNIFLAAEDTVIFKPLSPPKENTRYTVSFNNRFKSPNSLRIEKKEFIFVYKRLSVRIYPLGNEKGETSISTTNTLVIDFSLPVDIQEAVKFIHLYVNEKESEFEYTYPYEKHTGIYSQDKSRILITPKKEYPNESTIKLILLKGNYSFVGEETIYENIVYKTKARDYCLIETKEIENPNSFIEIKTENHVYSTDIKTILVTSASGKKSITPVVSNINDKTLAIKTESLNLTKGEYSLSFPNAKDILQRPLRGNIVLKIDKIEPFLSFEEGVLITNKGAFPVKHRGISSIYLSAKKISILDIPKYIDENGTIKKAPVSLKTTEIFINQNNNLKPKEDYISLSNYMKFSIGPLSFSEKYATLLYNVATNKKEYFSSLITISDMFFTYIEAENTNYLSLNSYSADTQGAVVYALNESRVLSKNKYTHPLSYNLKEKPSFFVAKFGKDETWISAGEDSFRGENTNTSFIFFSPELRAYEKTDEAFVFGYSDEKEISLQLRNQNGTLFLEETFLISNPNFSHSFIIPSVLENGLYSITLKTKNGFCTRYIHIGTPTLEENPLIIETDIQKYYSSADASQMLIRKYNYKINSIKEFFIGNETAPEEMLTKDFHNTRKEYPLLVTLKSTNENAIQRSFIKLPSKLLSAIAINSKIILLDQSISIAAVAVSKDGRIYKSAIMLNIDYKENENYKRVYTKILDEKISPPFASSLGIKEDENVYQAIFTPKKAGEYLVYTSVIDDEGNKSKSVLRVNVFSENYENKTFSTSLVKGENKIRLILPENGETFLVGENYIERLYTTSNTSFYEIPLPIKPTKALFTISLPYGFENKIESVCVFSNEKDYGNITITPSSPVYFQGDEMKISISLEYVKDRQIPIRLYICEDKAIGSSVFGINSANGKPMFVRRANNSFYMRDNSLSILFNEKDIRTSKTAIPGKVVYRNEEIFLNDRGEASLLVVAPKVGSYRMIATAKDGESFLRADALIKSRPPILIYPQAPESLTEEEIIYIPVSISNRFGIDSTIRFSASASFPLVGNYTKSLWIKTDMEEIAKTCFEARSFGKGEIIFYAASKGKETTLQKKIISFEKIQKPVYKYYDTSLSNFSFEEEGIVKAYAGKGYSPVLSRSADILKEPSFDSLEEIICEGFYSLEKGNAFTIKKNLSAIEKRRTKGGYSQNYENTLSSVWLSAFALCFINECEKNGFVKTELKNSLRNTIENFIKENTFGLTKIPSSEEKNILLPYLLYSLASGGESKFLNLNNYDGENLYALAYKAKVFISLGENEKAKTVAHKIYTILETKVTPIEFNFSYAPISQEAVSAICLEVLNIFAMTTTKEKEIENYISLSLIENGLGIGAYNTLSIRRYFLGKTLFREVLEKKVFISKNGNEIEGVEKEDSLYFNLPMKKGENFFLSPQKKDINILLALYNPKESRQNNKAKYTIHKDFSKEDRYYTITLSIITKERLSDVYIFERLPSTFENTTIEKNSSFELVSTANSSFVFYAKHLEKGEHKIEYRAKASYEGIFSSTAAILTSAGVNKAFSEQYNFEVK